MGSSINLYASALSSEQIIADQNNDQPMLSQDVLTYLFKYLLTDNQTSESELKDLLAIQLVCRDWTRAVNHLVYDANLTNNIWKFSANYLFHHPEMEIHVLDLIKNNRNDEDLKFAFIIASKVNQLSTVDILISKLGSNHFKWMIENAIVHSHFYVLAILLKDIQGGPSIYRDFAIRTAFNHEKKHIVQFLLKDKRILLKTNKPDI